MSQRIYLGILLAFAMPAMAQVQPAAVGAPGPSDADLRMTLPPSVSVADYPVLTGDETRSNYLRASVAVGAGYVDNAFSGEFPHPMAETTITVSPTVSLDRTTPVHRESLTYSPGFTFYRPSSQLDAIDQNANAEFDYHMGPYSGLQVTDSFLQTTNFFGQVGNLSAGGASGSSTTGQFLLVPFAEQISDTLRATFSRQYARDQMFGLGGSFGLLNFPNASQSPGLYNSKSGGGSGFYTRRILEKHYVGVSYNYTLSASSPPTGESNTSVQTILPFYTIYLRPTISISVAAGPQYYSVSETNAPTASGWTPVASGSIGSQTARTDFNLSYLHTVTGGGSLLGAYKQDSAAMLGRLQMTRTWTAGVSSNYSNVASATFNLPNTIQGGHSISGRGFVQRTFGEHVFMEAGYERIHQVYKGLALLANNPDSNRGYFSLTYQLARPLGR